MDLAQGVESAWDDGSHGVSDGQVAWHQDQSGVSPVDESVTSDLYLVAETRYSDGLSNGRRRMIVTCRECEL